MAVLGFANISGHGDDDWLGTGIAETVMSDLRGLPGLVVIAPAPIREAMRRAGTEGGEADEALATRVGRELGARWVLSGGFQRSGETVRVTARLADVEGHRVLRTVKFDGRLDDIFSLQDQIVHELASSLRLGMPALAEGEETHVVEAYEAYSRGVINMQLESYESLDRAILFFERALERDPRAGWFALQLAHCLALLGADDPFTRCYAAGIYAQLGEIGEAVACLEKAAGARRALTVARARHDPVLEPLWNEPRFQTLFDGTES